MRIVTREHDLGPIFELEVALECGAGRGENLFHVCAVDLIHADILVVFRNDSIDAP
ncbi:MAG: hypothetical protein IPM54_45710 [Polyangiaceae bacterium]|nr:hypothetical protein [Polyangiaceae bacterium]